VRVVAFNVAEGWSRDVTREIAEAVFELGRETLSSASSALLCSQRDEQSTGNPTVKGSSDVNITIPSEEEDALAESFQVE
jgi:hypothetical protein